MDWPELSCYAWSVRVACYDQRPTRTGCSNARGVETLRPGLPRCGRRSARTACAHQCAVDGALAACCFFFAAQDRPAYSRQSCLGRYRYLLLVRAGMSRNVAREPGCQGSGSVSYVQKLHRHGPHTRSLFDLFEPFRLAEKHGDPVPRFPPTERSPNGPCSTTGWTLIHSYSEGYPA